MPPLLFATLFIRHSERKMIEKFVIFSKKVLDKWRYRWYHNRARVGKLCVHCDDAGDCSETR